MCDGKKKRDLFNYGKTVKDYKKDRAIKMRQFQEDADTFQTILSEFKRKLFSNEKDNNNSNFAN